jgi:hypothetical protein
MLWIAAPLSRHSVKPANVRSRYGMKRNISNAAMNHGGSLDKRLRATCESDGSECYECPMHSVT